MDEQHNAEGAALKATDDDRTLRRASTEDEPDAAALEASDADDLFVVGIGASAGGLDALVKLFEAMPPDTGMTFVVVQHLSPDHKSLMSELLAKHTSMPVRQAADGMRVARDHIYLIPPRKNMSIFHRQLFLADQDRSQGTVNYPIDLFMESLAEDVGAQAISIVLSGTGSDGTRGIRTVKAAGGLVIVQDPETAQYSGMPRSAVRTGLVDQVLNADSIADALVRFVKYPRRVRTELRAADKDVSEQQGIQKVLSLLRAYAGVDFTRYKPTTVMRRIEHRMSLCQIPDLDAYGAYLSEEPKEIDRLYQEMLVGVTRFFRDPQAWAEIEAQVIPTIVKNAVQNGISAVRCWSAGCSTGEEPYTMAMLVHEAVDRMQADVDVKVFATDVDKTALHRAASGTYPESIAADVSPERLKHFFVRQGEQYQISRQLRQSVIFAPHNLLKDPPFSKLDLITCRNLLIYLKTEPQRKLLGNFQYALRNGGFLMLGTSESIGDEPAFAVVDARNRIFQYHGSPRSNIPVSSDPEPDPRRSASPVHIQSADWDRQPVALLETFFEDVLTEMMPTTVVVDSQNDVLHIFGDPDPFLRLRPGQATMNVLRMLRGNLRVLVGTALHKSRTTGRRVAYSGLTVDNDRIIDLLVDVAPSPDGSPFGIIVFRDAALGPDLREPKPFDVDAETEAYINTLRRRLQYTEENLQATVEELETSNEELQATNEELMASNEELQSTNEELQSVNEELVTVNAELQEKIRKLTEVNNDLDNLLKNTSISSLFLDRNLCIRKFTSSTTDLINVLPKDEGRPIRHFTHDFGALDLEADAETVMRTAEGVEREVKHADGGWYAMKVLPYWTSDERVDGVVLTFQDVNSRREATHRLDEERELRATLEGMTHVLSGMGTAVVTTDAEGRIAVWNDAAARLFGVPAAEAEGDALDAHVPLPAVDRTDGTSWAGRLSVEQDGRSVAVHARYRPLRLPDGRPSGTVLTAVPIELPDPSPTPSPDSASPESDG